MTRTTSPSTIEPALRLDRRSGLPDGLRVLARRYPRETWEGHANLGEMARFWLSRHRMFRELGDMLTGAIGRYREGGVDGADFRDWFAPRLQFLLTHLHTHHQIEDYHYFPIFRAADARLAPGFDLLENDHHVIHGAMDGAIETANGLLHALSRDDDTVRRGLEAYAAANDEMIRLLIRHLDDEEDLIVPLIADRGEAALGVGH